MARGERALVVLDLIIAEDGDVAEARVLHGSGEFAEAALAAAKQWRYEVTKVNGRPVRVHMTVPLSFAVKLPDVMRAEGIPEMRQGAAPHPPAGESKGATVIAQIDIDENGHITQAAMKKSESPWSESLLEALRTWRFASTDDGKPLSFELRAVFKGGSSAEVQLSLTDPRPLAADTASADAAVAASAVSPPAVGAEAPVAEVKPTSTAPPPDPRSGDSTPAPPKPRNTPPPVEVVSSPLPAAAPAAGVPAVSVIVPENGASTVRGIELAPGIPDLVKGRRPVAPPVARMSDTSGDVMVRFSIDSGGATSVASAEGVELLQEAATSLVRSWQFRRTSAHRVYAIAEIHFSAAESSAKVRPAE
jgi:TonB family protein